MAASSNVSQPSSDRLALLYQLSQTFNSTLDLDEVLNRVIDEVIVVLHAERGFVMLRDEKGQLVFRVARGMDQSIIQDPVFQVSLSTVESVARDGQPVLTGDAQVDPRFSMRQSVKLLGLRSILCVPLKFQNRILGTLYVDNRIQAGIFTQADLELLSSIASSAAIAIENARLYRLAVEKGRLEQELEMARQLQVSLLPAETPQASGWEFATCWLPARQVAGDYYDFIPGRNGNLGILVADVSDKGMPAALFMALTRSIMRASMDHTSVPMDGMRRANRLICADSTSGMFVTLFYAMLNHEKDQVTYCNAGHNPALLYKAGDQKRLIQLSRTGMALGVSMEGEYEQHTIQFSPGDCLVLYTDGVTDSMDADGNPFEMANLERAVLRYGGAPAKEIVAVLEREIEAHSGSSERFDDITIVVLKRV
jgi:phosphoserine phosphatase RsbU/P